MKKFVCGCREQEERVGAWRKRKVRFFLGLSGFVPEFCFCRRVFPFKERKEKLLIGLGANVDRNQDQGFVGIRFCFLLAVSFLAFVNLVEIGLHYYARGVVQTGLDAAARAGSRAADSSFCALSAFPQTEGELCADDTAALVLCEKKAHEVFSLGLGGPLGTQVDPICFMEEDTVVATVTHEVVWQAWFAGMPDFVFLPEARARKERAP